MKRTIAAVAVVMAGLVMWGAQAPKSAWEGTLETPAGKLRLRVNLSETADGLKATLDSLDQGAMGIPVTEVKVEGGKLTWRVAAIGASYEGALNAAGDTYEGTFTQGVALPLKLKRVEAASLGKPAARPQTPKAPFPYRSEDVKFSSKAAGVMLGGTLTMPEGKGPHPAMILITGSGAQDRDETLFGHKPFAVIADHLARRGIAVLRYDDRGVGQSTGTFKGATSADFALDAEGAFEYLLTRRELDRKRLGVGGHSEGGVVGPMVAARRKDVAFLVMLAGTGVNGEQVIYEQGAAILRANGAQEGMIAAQRRQQEAVFAAVKAGGSGEEILKRVKEKLGDNPAFETFAKQAADPWFRYFLTYDPAPALKQVKCPVLVMNGELDLQVLPSQNLGPIEAAFRAGGNKKVTVMKLPKLNHLFQTATTGSVSEYGQIEETMAPAALEALSGWLRGVARVK